MTEQVQESQQQTQDEQYLEQAQDFFARSMGRIKGQMQSDGAQLQGFMQQLPPDAQAQLQEITDSYTELEGPRARTRSRLRQARPRGVRAPKSVSASP